eukprot:gene10682-12632_t
MFRLLTNLTALPARCTFFQLFCAGLPPAVQLTVVLTLCTLLFHAGLDYTGVSDRMALAKDACNYDLVKSAQKRFFFEHGCEFKQINNPMWVASRLYFQVNKVGKLGVSGYHNKKMMTAGPQAGCVILSVMGGSKAWFDKIIKIHDLSGCVVFAYVPPAAYEEVNQWLEDKHEIYVKAFGTKTLDSEFTDLVKVIQPQHVITMVDDENDELEVLR